MEATPSWITLTEPTLWLLVFCAPLLEELVFRGGLQEALLRRWPGASGARQALWLSSLAFALGHALTRHWALGLAVLPAAWCLGRLYQARRSVLACAALHAAFNLTWLLAAPFLQSTPVAVLA